MTKTLTVEGDVTAANTATNLTTQGSITSPSVVTPAGVQQITKLIVAVAQDAAADGSATIIIRIGGNAVNDGEQVVVVACGGNITVQGGADPTGIGMSVFILDGAAISIDAVETIRIQAEMCGDDIGTVRVAATMVFA